MKKIVDVKDKKFGFLTPKEQLRINGLLYWKCVCDCGNIVYRKYKALHENESKNLLSSCGCKGIEINGKFRTLVGLDFGSIKILSFNKDTLLYECLDYKGNKIFLENKNLRSRIKFSSKVNANENEKMEKARFYKCKDFKEYQVKKARLLSVYQYMIDRCYNENNNSYKNYGKRGITVCDKWKIDKKMFVEWAFFNGYELGLEIDRIDNNKGYSPENCRWVTRKVNANNKRNNLMIDYNNKIQTLKQWCIELNLPYRQTHKRIYTYGWDLEKAFNKQ